MVEIAAGLSSASGARTVADLPGRAAEMYADRPALRFKGPDGTWRETTFAEAGRIVDEIALGLVALGVQPGDRVCILAGTRAEWSLASYGITAAGAVVVPIYPTNSPEECEWVAGNAGAVAIFCEDAGQLAKIKQVRRNLPELRHTIGIGPGAGEQTLEQLRATGREHGEGDELRRRQDAVDLDDPYTFIYTSGTTGPPKGCVLSHRNALSVGAMCSALDVVEPGDVTYLYLPLAHSFALTVHLASFDVGTLIVFFGGDTKQIVAEMAEARPTYLPSVPRIFEKIYTLATSAAAGEGRDLRPAVELGLRVRGLQRQGAPVPPDLQQAFDAADEQLYAPVRGLFGGNLRLAISGAAPIASEILEFFHACGVPVLEGWGLTETAALGTLNTPEHFKIGTIGSPLPGIELRIAKEDGEILLCGPNIFKEYWGNPEATAEALTDDGWLRTGDVGSIDEDGYVSITGRKKDIIITAGGKNLAPANLENDLKQSRWISQAVMHGDRRPYPVALITLDPEEIAPWAEQQGLPTDLPSLSQEPRVHALIQGELDRANAKYAQVEQIKRFVILDHDLTQERGELTPTLKVKRNVIEQQYADLLDGLYRR